MRIGPASAFLPRVDSSDKVQSGLIFHVRTDDAGVLPETNHRRKELVGPISLSICLPASTEICTAEPLALMLGGKSGSEDAMDETSTGEILVFRAEFMVAMY